MIYIAKLQGIEELKSRFAQLPRVVEKAEVSAVNKLGKQAETASNRSVREEYNIRAADVKKALSRIPARASYSGRAARLFTVLRIKGGRFGLHKFGGRPAQPASQLGVPIRRRKGWPTARVKKAAGRFKVRRDPATEFAPFVARMPSGHVGIFVRRDKRGRTLPQAIRELTAKSVAQMFDAHGREALFKLLAEKGVKLFKNELNFYLSKIRGGTP